MQETVGTKLNRKGLAIGLTLTLLVLIGVIYYLPAALNRSTPDTGAAGLTIGRAFPDFALRTIDGKTVTPASLSGKPYILWFTTSFCVPCQVGAERVAALDNRMGGDKFNVVVVFVDAREPIHALRSWRQKHASGDWMLAFDNSRQPLQQMVGLQYLDSKYLVDARGILRDADFQMVRSEYLKRIADVVAGG